MTVKNITSARLKPKEKSPRLLQSKSNYGARARSPTKQPEKNSAARHYLGIKGQDISVGNPGRLSAGLNKQLRVDRVRVFVRVSGVCAHFHAPACSVQAATCEIERERERAGRAAWWRRPGLLIGGAAPKQHSLPPCLTACKSRPATDRPHARICELRPQMP
jgi:hypothetical protein